jgi:hypothetical protein
LTQDWLDALNILRPTSQLKRDVVQLQAADILAHQVGRSILVSSERAPVPQRIYTKRLFGKPGMHRVMGIEELKERYREELWLDEMLSAGLSPQRILLRPIPQQSMEAVRALFASPEGL